MSRADQAVRSAASAVNNALAELTVAVANDGKPKKKNRKRNAKRDPFFTYIKRVLNRRVTPKTSINTPAVHMISDLIDHHVERICNFANLETHIDNKGPRTSSQRQLRFAIMSTFAASPDLSERMCSAGSQAVTTWLANVKKEEITPPLLSSSSSLANSTVESQ